MSVNDFKKRPRLSITITFECSGAFDPFTGFGEMNWTFSGSVSGQTGQTNPTVKEITCYPPTDPDVVWGFFSMPGSTGNNSGRVDTGITPDNFAARSFSSRQEGFWKVNTDPVLSEFGKVNNTPASRSIYYVVALPDAPGASVDTPIFINPPIDELRVVYPGDFVAIDRFFGTQRWYVYPQRRQPKPDRTFFWVPNEEPVLTNDGKADGVLVKPGTVMIPTRTGNVESENPLLVAGYFFEGVGIMFDGQNWIDVAGAEVAKEGEPGESWWPIPFFNSPQQDERRFDSDHSRKFLIETNTQKDQDSLSFKLTDSPETLTFASFGWISGGPGTTLGNLQPNGVFYDHGDSYSYAFKKRIQWQKENGKFPLSAGGQVFVVIGSEQPQNFYVYVDAFEDGNVTEWEETGVGFDGEELKNNYKVSVQITTTLE
jgi:hypothetical protein